jgi:hypothetical protein
MDMIDRACLLVCMVEEIDNIELTRSERIIASIFFAFRGSGEDGVEGATVYTFHSPPETRTAIACLWMSDPSGMSPLRHTQPSWRPSSCAR